MTGAGASQPLGLPLMKTFVSEDLLFRGSDAAQLVASLALRWAQANTKEIDFEYVYSLAHLLSNVEIRDPLAYPFLADPRVPFSWRVGTATKSLAISIDQARTGAIELRESLREHVHNSLRDFDHKKAAMIYGDFLKPFMEQPYKNAASLDVFTTNYDRAVEVIWEDGLQEASFGGPTVLVNGFRLLNPNRPSKEWAPESYDEAADPAAFTIRLYKLHGSLNWRRLGSGVLVETSTDDYSRRGEGALIYPLQVKNDQLGEPFATLFGRWRRAISAATDCIAIGASLRDPEILEPLLRRLGEASGFRLWIIDPGAEALQKRFGDVSPKVVAITSKFGVSGVGGELVKHILEDEGEPKDP